MRAGVTKAATVRAKTSIEPAATPGSLSGKVTRTKVWTRLAPRPRAASSSDGSIASITPTSERTATGKAKRTRPMVIPVWGTGAPAFPPRWPGVRWSGLRRLYPPVGQRLDPMRDGGVSSRHPRGQA
jgi:hypothetical protein